MIIMTIRVDIYKPNSGKWYASGEVEIPEGKHLWDKDILDVIEAAKGYPLFPGSIRKWFVVTKNTDEDGQFFMHLFKPTEIEDEG